MSNRRCVLMTTRVETIEATEMASSNPSMRATRSFAWTASREKSVYFEAFFFFFFFFFDLILFCSQDKVSCW